MLKTNIATKSLIHEIQSETPEANISVEEKDLVVFFGTVYAGRISKTLPVYKIKATVSFFYEMFKTETYRPCT